MATAVALRGQFTDLFGSSMLPVLEELFLAEMEMYPSLREKLFKVVSHDRDIWQSSEIHDMSLFSQVAEGSEYTFTRPKQGANKTLTVVKFGLGFSITEEMIDDGKFDLVADMTRKLARSAKETQQISAMNIFNNGFSTETTADGVAVYSSAHTLPSGLTFRNLPSTNADLSQSSLDTGLTDFATVFVGDSGIIYNIRPKYLLVHESNKRYAMELVGSDLKPDTADNNLNSLKNEGLIVVASPHIVDTDSWHLLARPEETGLRIVSRKPIETMSDATNGFTTDSILYKSRYREVLGVTHPYGVYGCAGA